MFKNTPKIVVIDIETKPIVARVWGLWDQNISQAQIEEDWSIIAFAAKEYLGAKKDIVYMDQRKSKDLMNETAILNKLWDILDQADYVITQNGDRFDIKKINARFAIKKIHNGNPPSSFIKIDTKKLASKHFGFTSNGLEYLSKNLNTKYKKSAHSKYPGMTLWNECMKGNQDAWKEMEKYNKFDILATEELYTHLRKYEDKIELNLYTVGETNICGCGSTEWKKNGIKQLRQGLFQRYVCKGCGQETRSKTNLLTKDKIKSLRVKVTR
jgi:DNA polymerase elongation subunit (family B)